MAIGESSPQNRERYLCAFLGRRDDYQVARALQDFNKLALFCTDFYCPDIFDATLDSLPVGVGKSLRRRRCKGVSSRKVQSDYLLAIANRLFQSIGIPPARIFQFIDAQFSRRIARLASEHRLDLLVYSAYAHYAFTHNYAHNPRKILFQYHPHIETEHRLLRDDRENFNEVFKRPGSDLEDLDCRPGSMRYLSDSTWKYADRILCASSFTRTSLIQAGAEQQIISVVPYGVDLPQHLVRKQDGVFRALFVGSGLQRKGLHHLLLAWNSFKVATPRELVLICRTIDPDIEDLAHRIPNVKLVRGVSGDQLTRLYQESSIFVMPSLIEGFGQVYLEALSYGLPVVGTPNTGLPDLGGREDGIFLCPAGKVQQLTWLLEEVADVVRYNANVSERARNCATRHSWQSFRKGVSDAVQR
ncbi:glycosyltransferase family 4 protein [Aestuariivirga sp.]|uniref:glycosyltransferase family 4 protein n=1 Tax=Aestuariivirga sp. TaxID=2650926 RepID=UPI003BAAE587